jgi:hypothetical protein
MIRNPEGRSGAIAGARVGWQHAHPESLPRLTITASSAASWISASTTASTLKVQGLTLADQLAHPFFHRSGIPIPLFDFPEILPRESSVFGSVSTHGRAIKVDWNETLSRARTGPRT